MGDGTAISGGTSDNKANITRKISLVYNFEQHKKGLNTLRTCLGMTLNNKKTPSGGSVATSMVGKKNIYILKKNHIFSILHQTPNIYKL